ncbi:hypothetical protein VP01_1348g2 [Puccinia sorghi]|uniref:Uncharacterized protein n=1 Tax=Puccinia sorghi TaxID=27349 RepID=A0A0L6VMF2_9BASI|nr:hypothetical protein VP01_1348g2 [Puccinia sorghi]
MLCDECVQFPDQITRQGCKKNRKLLGHFKEIQFTQADWIQIKHLKDELKVKRWRVLDLPVPLSWPIIIKQANILRRRRKLVPKKTPFIQYITRL